MSNTPLLLLTAPALTPLFKHAVNTSAFALPLSSFLDLPTFTMDDPCHTGETRLPDYKSVAYLAIMEWRKIPGTADYHPATDYTPEINTHTILSTGAAPESMPDQITNSLVILNSGQTLFSVNTPEAILADINRAEQKVTERLLKMPGNHQAPAVHDPNTGPLRRVSDVQKLGGGNPTAKLLATLSITAPVVFESANIADPYKSLEISVRDFRAITGIKELEWKHDTATGRVHPINHYTDELDRETIIKPVTGRKDGAEYPQSLITMEDGRTFICWQTREALTYIIEDAQKEALRKTSIVISELDYPGPQPMLQPKPEPKRQPKAVMEHAA